jgi:anti-sigma factor RsiW
MTIPEDRLLAYVDGLLSAEEIAEIERRLAEDAEARELVAALRVADLPYREAAETLIEVPDLAQLRQTIQSHRQPRQPRQSSFLIRYAPIAASIAIFFAIGLLAGQHVFPPAQPEPTKWAVWVDRIANYQALYSRATLAMPNPPAERRVRQMQRVSKAIGATVIAPDLSPLAADFKYARLYRIDGQSLAQIAYLPKSGEPFSLCLMKTDKPDRAPKYLTAHGQNVVAWRKNGVEYFYVGETPRKVLDGYISAIQAQLGA